MRFFTRKIFPIILVFVVFISTAFIVLKKNKITLPTLKVTEKVNLDGYQLVFFDDFNEPELDMSVWEHRQNGPWGYGFYGPNQVSLKDGNMVITAEYTTTEFGTAWHTGSIRLIERYKYGYFEVRCKPNKENDFWSAFWLQHPNAYKHELSQGGVHGAEIDVFETFRNKDITTQNFIESNIHCNGSNEDVENIDSKRLTKAYVPNLTNTFTTFGLMWTETEYIFYVNGHETERSSFGKGTSCELEEVILTLCIPKYEVTIDKNLKPEFLIDYLKIYQLAN